jgi:dCTP deaminase
MTTLSDVDIEKAMAAGQLIRNGTDSQLSGACYELRLGDVYYDLTEDNRRIAINANGQVLIKPGHRVVLITHEEVEVPHDMIARIVSKGSLFSVGLSPAATIADPGFRGRLGIVTQNISDKYIELPQLEAIAKIDFCRLSGSTTRPYVGQHGFHTEIWPIKTHLQKEHADVACDSRVRSEEEEALGLLPQATQRLLKRLVRRQRLADGLIVAALFVNATAILLVGGRFLDSIVAFVISVLANVAVILVTFFSRGKRHASSGTG